MWLVFLALHLVGLSGYNLILRRAVLDNVDRWTLATIMQTGITLPLLFILPFVHFSSIAYDAKDIGLIALIVPLVIVLHLTNVKSLQYLEASVYSVLYNLRILFTTILGIFFLNEKVVPLQIAGGLLIFLAIVTVRQKGKWELTRRGLQWGIAASFVISVLNLFEKELINLVGYLAYILPIMLSTGVLMWLILLARKQKCRFSTFKNPQILALMVFRAISAYGFGLAFYYGGELSVSSYISSLSVIIIVILGITLLGEKDYLKQKITATTLAATGLTCILLAHFL